MVRWKANRYGWYERSSEQISWFGKCNKMSEHKLKKYRLCSDFQLATTSLHFSTKCKSLSPPSPPFAVTTAIT
jgi:hypothetical protein